MKILLYVIKAFCIIRPLKPDYPLKFTNNLLSKTVVLIENEILYRRNSSELFKPVQEQDDLKTMLDIFVSKDQDWQDIDDTGKLVAEYQRTGYKNSFFFTAPDNKYYLYELAANTPSRGEYAMRTKIYEGRQKDPRIVSQTDTLLKELQRHIEQSIDYTGQISNVLKLDALDDLVYKSVISDISWIILGAIFLKLIVFFCMFYWFNRKLHEFYVSKKIVAK